MKKFYLFLILSLMCAVRAAAADAIAARIVVDDVSRVKVDVGFKDYPGIVNGLNIIYVEPGTTVGIEAREGCMLQTVTGSDDSGYTWNEFIIENVRCELRFYNDYNETFTVTSARNSDVRTGRCTVTVDDASKVCVERGGSHSAVELADGENVVEFDPATEPELVITPVDKPIYEICVDGVDITATSGYSYTVPVDDGTEIEIKANYPDESYSLRFRLSGHGAEDFLRGVDVDGKPVFDYMDDDFKVAAGSEVKLYGRTDEYEVDVFTVNDVPASFFNPYTFIMTGDAEVAIAVHKYASFLMTLCVDDPARIKAYRGYSYNGDEIELVAGDNDVEIRRDIPIISFVPADMCHIASAEVDGYVYEPEELKVSPFMIGLLTDGSRIDITTGNIVRDRHAMVYVNELSVAEGYFSLLRADRTAVEGIYQGYNLIEFYEGDNAFMVKTGAPEEAAVYLNDEICDAAYPGSYDYNVNLADGDVLKVFYGELPHIRLVSLEIDPGLDVALEADHIHTVDVSNGNFRALDRTHVSVCAPADAVLSLDGEPMTTGADGRYSFTVSGDHSLKVSGAMGVGSVGCEKVQPEVWYNMQGIRVDKPSSPGLYIVNGKKVRK